MASHSPFAGRPNAARVPNCKCKCTLEAPIGRRRLLGTLLLVGRRHFLIESLAIDGRRAKGRKRPRRCALRVAFELAAAAAALECMSLESLPFPQRGLASGPRCPEVPIFPRKQQRKRNKRGSQQHKFHHRRTPHSTPHGSVPAQSIGSPGDLLPGKSLIRSQGSSGETKSGGAEKRRGMLHSSQAMNGQGTAH